MQDLATLRDLDDFGPTAALAALPVGRKRRVLRSVSGHFLTYFRKRNKPPLVASIEDATPTFTLGASFGQAGTPGNALDVVIRFTAAGVLPGVPYKVSTDGGGTFGSIGAFPGSVVVDGVTTTISGAVAINNQVAYSTQVEEGIRLHVVGMASWYLLRNRGLDPAVEQELREGFDAAKAWLGDEADGLAELAADADATPEKDEGGPLADARTSPYAWARGGDIGWRGEA